MKRDVNSRFAKKIGANASTTAASRRTGTGRPSSDEFGIRNAMPSDTNSAVMISGLGMSRLTRCVTSMASRTASRTPVNTMALTSQVVPNSSAKVVIDRVSSSRKAAPMKNRSP